MLTIVPRTGARRMVWRRVVLACATVTRALWIWADAESTAPSRGACWSTWTVARVDCSWACADRTLAT